MSEPIHMRAFAQSLPMALLRAREASMRLFRPMLAQHDLTEQQWRVLRALAAADRPVEINEIAASTLLLGPSLARILARLKHDRLVERRPVAQDQRRVQVSLTDTGRHLVATIAPKSEALYGRIERHLGRARLAQLMDLLDEMAKLEADPRLEDAK